jgi:hypothetical protein
VGGVKNSKKGKSGLAVYHDTHLPMFVNGNVYLNDAITFNGEKNQLELKYDPNIRLEENERGTYLSMEIDNAVIDMKNVIVNSELLGRAKIPNQKYENPDGTEITIDRDYLGKRRNTTNPSAGPFSLERKKSIQIKVWPKKNLQDN